MKSTDAPKQAPFEEQFVDKLISAGFSKDRAWLRRIAESVSGRVVRTVDRYKSWRYGPEENPHVPVIITHVVVEGSRASVVVRIGDVSGALRIVVEDEEYPVEE